MNRNLVLDLIDFMYWCNHRLLDAAGRLSVAEFVASSQVTTRDLRATLVHELDVEWSWRQRLQGRPEGDLAAGDFPTVAVLRERWTADEAEMRAWLAGLIKEDLAAEVPADSTRDRFPLGQYLVHVVMHAAQQQADAATLLTAAGQSPGSLDYLEFLSPR